MLLCVLAFKRLQMDELFYLPRVFLRKLYILPWSERFGNINSSVSCADMCRIHSLLTALKKEMHWKTLLITVCHLIIPVRFIGEDDLEAHGRSIYELIYKFSIPFIPMAILWLLSSVFHTGFGVQAYHANLHVRKITYTCLTRISYSIFDGTTFLSVYVKAFKRNANRQLTRWTHVYGRKSINLRSFHLMP